MTTDSATETAAVVTRTGNATACALCHADGPNLDASQLRAGAWWRCKGCGQLWDHARMAAVAAYAAFCADRVARGVN